MILQIDGLHVLLKIRKLYNLINLVFNIFFEKIKGRLLMIEIL